MYPLGTIALKFYRHLGNNPGSAAEVPVRFQSNAVDFDVLLNQHVNHASYPFEPCPKRKKDSAR